MYLLTDNVVNISDYIASDNRVISLCCIVTHMERSSLGPIGDTTQTFGWGVASKITEGEVTHLT
jgi:hypothetical protein